MIYTVKNQPDIFSLIMAVYGTLDESVQLLSDNELALNSPITPGMQINYNPSYVYQYVPSLGIVGQNGSTPANTSAPASLTFTAREGQNLFDVALNCYGNLENYVNLIVENSIPNSLNPKGISFTFDPNLIGDVNLYNMFTGKGYYFSTGSGFTGGGFSDGFSSGFQNQPA